MRILARPAVGVRDDGARALQHHDRPPLLGRLARGGCSVCVDRVGGLAGQASELARMRSQDSVLAQLAFGALRVGQRIQPVGVDDQRASRVQRQVDDQPPGGAVAAQARSHDADLRGGELAEDGVVRGVADRAGGDLRDRRRHDLGAFGGEDGIDRVRDQQPDEAGAGPRRGGRGEKRRAGEAEAPGQHDGGAEGALVGVFRPHGDEHGVGCREHGARVRDLEVGGGHGQAAVVGDAHLDLGAAIVAQQAGAGGAVGARQDLDPPARKADSGAVEAFDHRFLGRPAPGEPLVVARAVRQLRGGVDLGEEAGAGAFYREGDPVDGDRVDADALHGSIVAAVLCAPLSLTLPPEGGRGLTQP